MRRFVLLFIFLAMIFLSHYAVARQAVYGDGIDYWAYLHSLYFDHDLDFENEFKHIYSAEFNNQHPDAEAAAIQKTYYTPLGKADNPHLPGVAVLLWPFYTAADVTVLVLSGLGLPLLRNGYADMYQIFCGLGAVLYVVLGTLFMERMCQLLFRDVQLSKLAAIMTVLASPLLYYGAYDIINSHFASFFLVSLFWYLVSQTGLQKATDWMITGLVLGGLTLVRLQDGLLVVPFVWLWLRSKQPLSRLGLGLATFGVMTLPLWFLWNYLYGSPYPRYYLTIGHIYRGVWGSLFHPTNGLLSRTPLLLLALLPLPAVLKETKGGDLIKPMLLYLAISVGVITYQGGWLDPAYGGRMYVSSLPLFALLIVRLFQWIKQNWGMKFLYALVLAFGVANMVSISSFVLFEKEVNSGKRRGLEEQTLIRLQPMLPPWLFR